jgi:hypothetical protein
MRFMARDTHAPVLVTKGADGTAPPETNVGSTLSKNSLIALSFDE